MRVTVILDPDAAAAVERERRERNVDISDVTNRLGRLGLAGDNARRRRREPFRQRTLGIGIAMDIANVAEALDEVDRLDATAGGPDRACRGVSPGSPGR